MDDEQRVVGDQAATGPDFLREEIGGPRDIQMRLNELLLGKPLAAGARRQPMLL